MANKKITIGLDVDMSEIERVCIGARAYDALHFTGHATERFESNIVHYNKDKGKYVITQKDLNKLIELVNPMITERDSQDIDFEVIVIE